MWEKIKRILQKEGGKCIIMEEGEPIYIVAKLDDCKEYSDDKSQDTEKVNKNITEWKNKEADVQNEELSRDSNEESKGSDQEVKIEDLPF